VTRRVDLSALAAENTDDFIEADFGDRVFKLHATLRWNTSRLWNDDQHAKSMATLLLDPTEAEEFVRRMTVGNPDVPELASRVNRIFADAEDLMGEAPASSAPSPNGGTPSRPTSKRSTGSTSGT